MTESVSSSLVSKALLPAGYGGDRQINRHFILFQRACHWDLLRFFIFVFEYIIFYLILNFLIKA